MAIPSWDGDTNFTKAISDSPDVEEAVVHLAELLIGVPVVCPSLGGPLYPLVTMLTLMEAVLRNSHQNWEARTIAVV